MGRRQELGHLLDRYQRAKNGQGQVIGIVGEPGVGKSRLVLRMREAVATDQCSLLEGQCLHYGESVPYLPLLGILRSYFGVEEGEPDPSARAKMKNRVSRLDERLQGLLPPLCDLLSLKVEDDQYLKLEPKDRKEKVFQAIRNLLIRESQNHPLIVVVEDLHWMDKASEEFLDHLIGRLAGARILLLLLYRPEYTHSWGSKTYYSQVSLDEFPPEASLEMVQALFAQGQVADDMRDLVLQRSAGNALFMEEFSRTLLDKGHVTRRGGRYVLLADPARINVPETLQGLIGARIDGLEDDVKQTMQAASVIGREFPLAILRRLIPEEKGLEDRLSRLQALELVYETSAFPDAEYAFKHAMTQEVAYSSLLLKHRKDLHGRIGRAIEELHPDRADEFCEALAWHYSMAEDAEKAAHFLRLSGDKAQRSYSSREAFDRYRGALEALSTLPDTEQNRRARLDVILSWISIMWALNYPEGCSAVLEAGLKIAEELGDRPAALRLSSVIGNAYMTAGNAPEALRFSRKAFDEAEALGDDTTAVELATHLCAFYYVSGDSDAMADVAGRAIALLGKTGTTPQGSVPGWDLYADVLYYLGMARGFMGDLDEGERLCDAAVDRAAKTMSPMSQTMAHMMSATVAMGRSSPRPLLRHAREGRQLSERLHLDVLSVMFWALESFGHYFDGNAARARECAEKSIALIRNFLGRAMAEADPSDVSAAEQSILDGLRMLEDLHHRPEQAVAHLCLGESYALAGQRDEALASLQRAQRMGREMGMEYWLARTEKAMEELSA